MVYKVYACRSCRILDLFTLSNEPLWPHPRACTHPLSCPYRPKDPWEESQLATETPVHRVLPRPIAKGKVSILSYLYAFS